MCGIIGYVGNKKASDILLNGLKRLEYRGYDSCGVVTVTSEVNIKKDVGKVAEVDKKHSLADLDGTMGMAHTRWVTYGGVTKENSHPHTDCKSQIIVVHNGIIENYQELKAELGATGHQFKSQTDTEIIPHLIEEHMSLGNDFESACMSAMAKLEGNYAVLIIKKGERKIVASRRGSPLVLGMADHGFFAASDIPAFLEHTKKVIYLYDGDFVVLSDHMIKIFNIDEGKQVDRPIDSVDWDMEQAKKGEFEHFMMKEISDQLDTVQRAAKQDKAAIDFIVNEIKNSKGIFFIGCGTSYHACLAASYVFSKVADMHV